MVHMNRYYEARKKLVDKLIKEGILKSELNIKAMLKVPRHYFVWPGYEKYAYIDHALPLGNTGQTISAPHMCAYMMEELRPLPGNYILEIGAGSGYQAALLAEIAAPDYLEEGRWGHVTSIEVVRELVDYARRNIKRIGLDDRVIIIHGDGSIGYPPYYNKEIYDRIIVTAAAPHIPKMLIKQLKRGGILVAPIGNMYIQDLVVLKKEMDGKLTTRRSISCMFVPLIGRDGWQDGRKNNYI